MEAAVLLKIEGAGQMESEMLKTQGETTIPEESADGVSYLTNVMLATGKIQEKEFGKGSGWNALTWWGDDYGVKYWSYGPSQATIIPFVDVACVFKDVQDKNNSYYNAVYWAKDLGVTNGIGDGKFGLNDNVKRGQMLTFVYRYYQAKAAAGEEKYNTDKTYDATPFKDVKDDKYYADAVKWAYHNGIAEGYSNDAFGPDDTVTRAQMVTFLYRASKKFGQTDDSKISDKSAFPDVPEGRYFTKAVAWAADNGVTEGYENGNFGPSDNCKRGQGVTFLYRGDGKSLFIA